MATTNSNSPPTSNYRLKRFLLLLFVILSLIWSILFLSQFIFLWVEESSSSIKLSIPAKTIIFSYLVLHFAIQFIGLFGALQERRDTVKFYAFLIFTILIFSIIRWAMGAPNLWVDVAWNVFGLAVIVIYYSELVKKEAEYEAQP